MKLNELFEQKHALWLSVLFSGFSHATLQEKLYDFAMIEFRHLKWLAKEMRQQEIGFSLDRSGMVYQAQTTHELLQKLKVELEKMRALYESRLDEALFFRMDEDEKFFISAIETMLSELEEQEIRAFNKNLRYKNLDKTSMNALMLFLFEESYKEYELIMIYFYQSMHTHNQRLYSIFEDLIHESFFHLKRFALLMREVGILTMPRELLSEVYRFDNLEAFLVDGIAEEMNAKEQCRALAKAVNDEELENFFNFINHQENYHIALMQEALEQIE